MSGQGGKMRKMEGKEGGKGGEKMRREDNKGRLGRRLLRDKDVGRGKGGRGGVRGEG